jgi:hypothetical protein
VSPKLAMVIGDIENNIRPVLDTIVNNNGLAKAIQSKFNTYYGSDKNGLLFILSLIRLPSSYNSYPYLFVDHVVRYFNNQSYLLSNILNRIISGDDSLDYMELLTTDDYLIKDFKNYNILKKVAELLVKPNQDINVVDEIFNVLIESECLDAKVVNETPKDNHYAIYSPYRQLTSDIDNLIYGISELNTSLIDPAKVITNIAQCLFESEDDLAKVDKLMKVLDAVIRLYKYTAVNIVKSRYTLSYILILLTAIISIIQKIIPENIVKLYKA